MDSKVVSVLLFALILLPGTLVLSDDSDGAFDINKLPYDFETLDSDPDSVPKFTITGSMLSTTPVSGSSDIRIKIIASMNNYVSPEENDFQYMVNPIVVSVPYDFEKGRWDFSVDVPVLDNLKQYEYYIHVQDGYRIFTVPASTVSTEPTHISAYDYDEDIMNISDVEFERPEGWNTQDYVAYKILNSVSMTAGSILDLTGDNPAGFFTLESATTTLTGNVTNNGVGIYGVKVSLSSSDAPDTEKYSVETEADGSYVFLNIPTGRYILKVWSHHYQAEPVEVELTAYGTVRQDVIVDPIPEDLYLGYDLPHFLMIIGGLLCAVIIVMSAIMQIRFRRGKKKDWILDDIDDDLE